MRAQVRLATLHRCWDQPVLPAKAAVVTARVVDSFDSPEPWPNPHSAAPTKSARRRSEKWSRRTAPRPWRTGERGACSSRLPLEEHRPSHRDRSSCRIGRGSCRIAVACVEEWHELGAAVHGASIAAIRRTSSRRGGCDAPRRETAQSTERPERCRRGSPRDHRRRALRPETSEALGTASRLGGHSRTLAQARRRVARRWE